MMVNSINQKPQTLQSRPALLGFECGGLPPLFGARACSHTLSACKIGNSRGQQAGPAQRIKRQQAAALQSSSRCEL